MFGFLGPNAAGKTTAMQVVMGVTEPDAGEVLWRGSPLTDVQRLRFGYMPEERGLYARMRVREQLVYLARLHGLSPGRATDGADHWLERFGLTSRATDRVEQLSLGNQQRVQLIAALVHDPEVLILDEPFSGLDPIGVDDLATILMERAAAGVAVVFSSHQLDLVEHLCESVAIINDGKLVMCGAVEELKSKHREQRLLVRVEDSTHDWTEALPGIAVVDRRNGFDVLSLSDGMDHQAVLEAARSAGVVTHFSFERPKLSELFLEAVGR